MFQAKASDAQLEQVVAHAAEVSAAEAAQAAMATAQKQLDGLERQLRGECEMRVRDATQRAADSGACTINRPLITMHD